MMEDLPKPLIGPEVDLRDLPGFVLNVERLLSSELVALGTPEECWAALRLWCRAWQQVPAGSLPNDDRVLASYSEAGRRWPKVREMALRGFVLCSDGRFYHRFLCEEALRAWERKKAYQTRRETDRKRLSRWREKRQGNVDADGDETRFTGVSKPLRNDRETHGETRSNVREDKSSDSPNGESAARAACGDPVKAVFDAGLRVLTTRGVSEHQARSIVGKGRKIIADDGRLLSIILSIERNNPVDAVAYLHAAIRKATNGGVIPMHPGAGG
jgi:hypothetical protein